MFYVKIGDIEQTEPRRTNLTFSLQFVLSADVVCSTNHQPFLLADREELALIRLNLSSFSASGGLTSAPVDGGSSSSGRAAAAAFHTGVGGSAAKLAAEQLYHFTQRDYASSYSHYQVGVLTN